MPPFVALPPGKQSGVYAAYCKTNGKIYVGSSCHIKKRWVEHKRTLKKGESIHKHLQYAWNKYGSSAFVWGVLELCSTGQLLYREEVYIRLYDSSNNKFGFNTHSIPESASGVIRSAETKAKLRAKWADPGVRAKRVAAVRKTTGDPQFRAEHSDRMKEVYGDPDTKAKMTAVMQSPETRAKRSAGIRKTAGTVEAKAKRSVMATEIGARPEVKSKIAKATKERYRRPGEIARHAETMKVVAKRPGQKEKRALATKMSWADPESRARRIAGLKAAMDRKRGHVL